MFNAMEDVIKLEMELAFPIWAKPFYLDSNTSDVQLSATLCPGRKKKLVSLQEN